MESIHALLGSIGWQRVEWCDHRLTLPAGMESDFGGIGKEYAADRAATLLAERGIARALVDLGGDVRALGAQEGGAPWRVGIRHPRGARPDEAVAAIEVVDAAVATSGDYERFIEIDGRRYCHILDPRSGWPVTHWQSVSVVAPLAIVAGSCATIAMLLGARAPDFLHAQGVRWLGVAADGQRCGEA
jgi:thiamine biosynthesis lipoprotein